MSSEDPSETPQEVLALPPEWQGLDTFLAEKMKGRACEVCDNSTFQLLPFPPGNAEPYIQILATKEISSGDPQTSSFDLDCFVLICSGCGNTRLHYSGPFKAWKADRDASGGKKDGG